MVLRKVDGKNTPSDIVTKGLGITDIEKMLGLMEAFFRHTDLQDKDPEGQFRGGSGQGLASGGVCPERRRSKGHSRSSVLQAVSARQYRRP